MAGTTLMYGALLGVSVTAPVGPMSVLCISRTVATGFWTGFSTGVGATTVQVGYCTLVLLGMQSAASWLDGGRQIFLCFGAVLMLAFAYRLLRARRGETLGTILTKRSMAVSYGSAVLFNCMNPVLPVLLMAAIASTLGASAPRGLDAGLFVLGLLVGSMTWWTLLVGVTALLRTRLDPRALGLVDKGAAAMLAGLGTLALARVIVN